MAKRLISKPSEIGCQYNDILKINKEKVMDEILKKLLESELLSEDTKAQISEQWATSVEVFKTQVREEVSMVVRSELAEEWIQQRDQFIEKVDSFVTEALNQEIEELRGSIESFRDLEAEYVERIVEEKHNIAAQVQEELSVLVDKLDAFLEQRISEEMQEFSENLEIVKQNEFGRKIYEAFATTYANSLVDDNTVASKLKITESQLSETTRALRRTEEQLNEMTREIKLEKLLGGLSGKKREQMEMVLKNVETEQLEESYKYFIKRILKEDTSDIGSALLENEGSKPRRATEILTGDNKQSQPQVDESIAYLRRLAGIKS
jgi:hypothetical protein